MKTKIKQANWKSKGIFPNEKYMNIPRSHVTRGNAYENPNYQKRSTSNRPSTSS